MKLDNVYKVSSTGPGGRGVCVCVTQILIFFLFELRKTVLVMGLIQTKGTTMVLSTAFSGMGLNREFLLICLLQRLVSEILRAFGLIDKVQV